MTAKEAYSRCWAEIDLDAVRSNFLTARKLLSRGAEIICVLKANAYGLGAARVSRCLYESGARFFAVACLSEAEEIKRLLPDAQVLVMGMVGEEECERAIREDVLLTCHSPSCAAAFMRAAEKAGRPARVHVKIDTGLHRLGFDESSEKELIGILSSNLLKIEGLYTHLALRDKEGDEKQFRLFDRFDALLSSHGCRGFMRHACDSIGMVRYPERHMDAVRIGAWLYGVCPNRYEHPELDRLALRFAARVSDVHKVPAGDYIGYDEEHPVERDCTVATLSAGYVDGYPRLNNVGEVEILGRRARVLGLVCMDQMMVDVTDIPECRPGDEAVLLGGGIKLNDYAAAAHMNRNECLCRMGRRVPKIYLENGKIESIFCEM